MAQLVRHLTLDFGSGYDLMVHEIEPRVGFCTDSVESAWDSLALSLSLSLSFSLSFSPRLSFFLSPSCSLSK